MTTQPASAIESPQTGIFAYIYRNTPGTDFNVLREVEGVVIVGPGIIGTAMPSDRHPAVRIGVTKFQGQVFQHLRPLSHEDKWLMFDDEYVHSTQPDFQAAFPAGFVKLHARYEGR